MEITLITYLKAKPLALCTLQIITTIPITEMYFFHYIYVHFQPKCKYTTIESRHFQLVKMNFELKSNTSPKSMKGNELPPLEEILSFPTKKSMIKCFKRLVIDY